MALRHMIITSLTLKHVLHMTSFSVVQNERGKQLVFTQNETSGKLFTIYSAICVYVPSEFLYVSKVHRDGIDARRKYWPSWFWPCKRSTREKRNYLEPVDYG